MRHYILFAVFWLLPLLGHAHAVVTAHSLQTTPIQANKATQVQLTFNSQVEKDLSQVFLVSAGDKQTLLKIESGEGQGQVSIAIPKLKPGDYALKYKIFAADGHLTEDVIHFSVKP